MGRLIARWQGMPARVSSESRSIRQVVLSGEERSASWSAARVELRRAGTFTPQETSRARTGGSHERLKADLFESELVVGSHSLQELVGKIAVGQEFVTSP
jgi:hypothetical protein